jgi:hypothetical protein
MINKKTKQMINILAVIALAFVVYTETGCKTCNCPKFSATAEKK